MSEYNRQLHFALPILKDTQNYFATPSFLNDGPNSADVIVEKTFACPVQKGDQILTLDKIINAQQDVTILDPDYSNRPYEAEDFHNQVDSLARRLFRMVPNPVRQLILETISNNRPNNRVTRKVVDMFNLMDEQAKMAVCAANYNLAVSDPKSEYGNLKIGKVVQEIYDAGTYDVEQCGTCVLRNAKDGVATRSCGTIFKARGVIGAENKSS